MTLPKLIKEIKSVSDLITEHGLLLNKTIQSIDLNKVAIDWKDVKMANTTFLGCDMSPDIEAILRSKGATIFPKIVGLPYNPYRKELYKWQKLMDNNHDLNIYNHFNNNKFTPDINEALSQRIHDHAIDDALRELIGLEETGMTEKKCVGIMGGHDIKRTDPEYKKAAQIAKKLTENGFFIMSGGGPGIMEAANLGAYMAAYSDQELDVAIEMLVTAPHYTNENYLETAKSVLEYFPNGKENLAIPTWFYGHEPPNIFATSIAKYFSNSLREDVLLATAIYGIVYAPGSAGTIQEIFTDAAQQHYQSYGYLSPMVFFGKKHWSEDIKVYQLLMEISKDKTYHNMITISDEVDEIVNYIIKTPPVKE